MKTFVRLSLMLAIALFVSASAFAQSNNPQDTEDPAASQPNGGIYISGSLTVSEPGQAKKNESVRNLQDANQEVDSKYDFQSTGSEAGDIAKKQELMQQMQQQRAADVQKGGDAIDKLQMQNPEKTILTQEQFNAMSQDEQAAYNENPDNYIIIDSNK